MSDTPPPRWTGKTAEVDLTGKLFPWRLGQPVLLEMPGDVRQHLPCFSTAEHLRTLMATIDVPYESIKQIENGTAFLSSFTPRQRETLRVVLDPTFQSNGRMRYTEVLWESAPNPDPLS